MTAGTPRTARALLDALPGRFHLRTSGVETVTLDAWEGLVLVLSHVHNTLVALTPAGHRAWVNGADVVDLDERDLLAVVGLDDEGGPSLAAYVLRRAEFRSSEQTDALLADLAGIGIDAAYAVNLAAEVDDVACPECRESALLDEPHAATCPVPAL